MIITQTQFLTLVHFQYQQILKNRQQISLRLISLYFYRPFIYTISLRLFSFFFPFSFDSLDYTTSFLSKGNQGRKSSLIIFLHYSCFLNGGESGFSSPFSCPPIDLFFSTMKL